MSESCLWLASAVVMTNVLKYTVSALVHIHSVQNNYNEFLTA